MLRSFRWNFESFQGFQARLKLDSVLSNRLRGVSGDFKAFHWVSVTIEGVSVGSKRIHVVSGSPKGIPGRFQSCSREK